MKMNVFLLIICSTFCIMQGSQNPVSGKKERANKNSVQLGFLWKKGKDGAWEYNGDFGTLYTSDQTHPRLLGTVKTSAINVIASKR